MASQQAQDLRQIYHHIIDDVVAKMKPGFLQESVDESVLQAMRQRWAQKLIDKNIISEPEAQPQPVVVKKDEDGQSSRKRPYDGSAPNNRQEAAAAGGGAAGGAPINMHMKGPPPHMMLQQRPQAQVAGLAGIRPGYPHSQIPLPRNMTAAQAGLAAAQQQQHASLLQQIPGQPGVLLPNAIASVHQLPQHQQAQVIQAHLQNMQNMQNMQRAGQMRPQGQAMPAQPQMATMPGNQGMAAAQQLQGMAGLRAQGLPHQAGLSQQVLQQQGLQQQVLQHHMLQQQALQQQALQQQQQQQQGLRIQGIAPNLQQPGAPAANLQGMLPQAMLQRIPQGDGSADLPPSVEEVAAAAGMQPQQLRAILPPRIAAIMDRPRPGSSNGSGGESSKVTAAAAGPAAAAAGTGSSRAGKARLSPPGSRAVRHRRPCKGVIPQVDGGGDEDEEDYVGDDGGDAAGGEEGEDEEAEAEEESDESDDPEMAKFSAEMDAAEEADKVESGDVGFALYEKVHRAKNRWRCNLRYGVFLINGKEYMFNKANTDFTF